MLMVLLALSLYAQPAFSQYGSESFIESFVGGNLAIPTGDLSGNLQPDSLNAGIGFGVDLGAGYYLKPKIVVGVFFSSRSMKTKELGLHHRAFDIGMYGKYLLNDVAAVKFSPYVKGAAGVNFSKLARVVEDDGINVFREISQDPTLAAEFALGLQYKNNEFGGLFLEGAAHYDLSGGNSGDYREVSYPWNNGNNMYMLIRAGIIFNIGRKE